jgi:hypothetical protein
VKLYETVANLFGLSLPILKKKKSVIFFPSAGSEDSKPMLDNVEFHKRQLANSVEQVRLQLTKLQRCLMGEGREKKRCLMGEGSGV